MEEAEPQQRRRLDSPLLNLSLYPTLAGAIRQLGGTGAKGPRRPPAGAIRLRHTERPGSWPVPEDTPSGQTHRKDRPSAPQPTEMVFVDVRTKTDRGEMGDTGHGRLPPYDGSARSVWVTHADADRSRPFHAD